MAIHPGQLVVFPHGHFPRMVGKVVRVVDDTEPAPGNRDFMLLISCGGTELLKRISDVRPLATRTDHIIACGGEIG